jgi:cation-transporting ATPase 13A3/4/5
LGSSYFRLSPSRLPYELTFDVIESFAFYRDSFRFIGVLGMVAVCGFIASSFNFVKLGVSEPFFSLLV